MTVKLLHYTPLEVADLAIGKCWDKTTDKPAERMYRVANKYKHASTIEHINYNFDIDGVSRALLQEIVRHRHASISVQSTRYTLKELRDAPESSLKDFLVSPNPEVLERNLEALRYLKMMLKGMSNDEAKYMLPEAYKTSFVWTINMRSLQNFLSLRTDKSALWEIRDLAHEVYRQVPESHKFMLEEFVKDATG